MMRRSPRRTTDRGFELHFAPGALSLSPTPAPTPRSSHTGDLKIGHPAWSLRLVDQVSEYCDWVGLFKILWQRVQVGPSVSQMHKHVARTLSKQATNQQSARHRWQLPLSYPGLCGDYKVCSVITLGPRERQTCGSIPA